MNLAWLPLARTLSHSIESPHGRYRHISLCDMKFMTYVGLLKSPFISETAKFTTTILKPLLPFKLREKQNKTKQKLKHVLYSSIEEVKENVSTLLKPLYEIKRGLHDYFYGSVMFRWANANIVRGTLCLRGWFCQVI